MPRHARESSGTGIYHVMMLALSYEPDGTPSGRNYILYAYCLMTNELVNEPLSDDVVCLDIEDTSKGRPSDDQVMMLIKEKTGATNSSAFQHLPAEIKKSVLIELKGKRALLRQLERLTGISKSMIYRM